MKKLHNPRLIATIGIGGEEQIAGSQSTSYNGSITLWWTQQFGNEGQIAMPDLENNSLPTRLKASSGDASPTQNSATVEQTPPVRPSVKPQRSLLSQVPEWLTTWVSLVTAVVSLIISLYTFAITTYEPELLLMMPNQVRLAQGGQGGAVLYIQPMFISTGMSERVEVITGIRLQVEPINQSFQGIEFVWDEQGEWVPEPGNQNFNWVFTGDSAPFLVSPKNAQYFTGLFIGPDNWLFEPGAYRITMIADRITNSQPLNASIEVLLSAENIDYLNQSEGTRFLLFPVQK